MSIGSGEHEGQKQTEPGKGMPGAGLTGGRRGKALPERPALKPYWGKPAVRNFRGGDGDVGIIRSPVRAIPYPTVGRGDLRPYGALARGGVRPDLAKKH